MINLEDITTLAEEGWEIKTRRKDPHIRVGIDDIYPIKGQCAADEKAIYIWKKNCESKEDIDTTLIHEVMHACYPELNETEVETRAIICYNEFPEVLDYIKDLFEIRW